MSRRVNAISVALLCLVLAACSATSAPVTTEAECRLIPDPGFPVQGKRLKDQRWVSKVQEIGIDVCGHPRPKAEPPETVVTVTTLESS